MLHDSRSTKAQVVGILKLMRFPTRKLTFESQQCQSCEMIIADTHKYAQCACLFRCKIEMISSKKKHTTTTMDSNENVVWKRFGVVNLYFSPQNAPIPFDYEFCIHLALKQIFSLSREHIKQISFDKHVKTSVRISLSCIFKTGNRTSQIENLQPELRTTLKAVFETWLFHLSSTWKFFIWYSDKPYLNKRIFWLVDLIRLGIQSETQSGDCDKSDRRSVIFKTASTRNQNHFHLINYFTTHFAVVCWECWLLPF